MYWDRLDICQAWFLFACDWHQGQDSWEYEIFGRLGQIGFQPGLNLTFDALTENGKAIYNNLVEEHTQ